MKQICIFDEIISDEGNMEWGTILKATQAKKTY